MKVLFPVLRWFFSFELYPYKIVYGTVIIGGTSYETGHFRY